MGSSSFRDSDPPAALETITMTTDSNSADEIESAEDFEDALHGLLVTALESGVDPRGSWEYRSDGLPSDWEVMILELQARKDQ